MVRQSHYNHVKCQNNNILSLIGRKFSFIKPFFWDFKQGLDTTSATLTYAFLALGNHPKVQVSSAQRKKKQHSLIQSKFRKQCTRNWTASSKMTPTGRWLYKIWPKWSTWTGFWRKYCGATVSFRTFTGNCKRIWILVDWNSPKELRSTSACTICCTTRNSFRNRSGSIRTDSFRNSTALDTRTLSLRSAQVPGTV